MKLKKFQYIVCVSMLLLVLSVNTSAVPAAIPIGGTLTTMIGQDPAVLNPLAWATTYDYPIINHIYDPLAKTDLDQNTYPGTGLATGWTRSADSKTWVFNIYDNATWHDGVPVTIDDIYYSHAVLWNDSSIPRYSWLYDYLTNITVLNTTAIQFEFSYGYKDIQVLTEVANAWILPKHIWENVADTSTFANDNPIGCGIWVFEEWAHGNFFRFSRNENYHLSGPYLTEKIVKIIPGDYESAFYELQIGDLDVLVGQIPPELEAFARDDPNLEIWQGLDDWVDYLGMNQRRYPNDEVKFRQAVSHAINRTQIVESAYWGRGIVADAGMSLPYGPYYEPDIRQYEYDVVKANAMLDALGWDLGTWDGTTGVRETPNGTKLSFDFQYVSTSEQHINVAFLMQQYMAAIGVELTLNPQVFDIEWHNIGGDGSGTRDFDWYYVGWTIFWSDHHPSWMEWMFDEDGMWGSDTYNLPGWSGTNRSLVTDLTHDVALELDEAIVADLLSQAQKIVAESLPYTPIMWRGQMEIYRVDELEGWITAETTFGSPNNYRSWRNLRLKEEPEKSVWTLIYTTVISGETVVKTTIFTSVQQTGGFSIVAAIASIGTAFYIIKRRKRR